MTEINQDVLDQIDELIDEGKLRRASAQVARAMKKHPDAPALLARSAQILAGQDKLAGAVVAARRLVDVAPDDTGNWRFFAELVEDDADQLAAVVDEALALHPNDAVLLARRASMAAASEGEAAGLAVFEAALQRAPGDFEILYLQAEFLQNLAQARHDRGRFEQAETIATQVIERCDDQVLVVNTLVLRANVRHAQDDKHGVAADLDALKAIAEDESADAEARAMAAISGLIRLQLQPESLGDLFTGMADMVEEPAPGKSMSKADHDARLMLQATEARIRAGATVCSALNEIDEDDPFDIIALTIAQQQINLANEPDPEFEPADARLFPRYMRRHADRSQRQLEGLGFECLGDFEIVSLRAMMGQSVLLRVFNGPNGETSVASYAIRPMYPGVIAWLELLVKGLWRPKRVVEFETYFDDGSLIATNNTGGVNPYTYGDKIDLAAVPLGTAVAGVAAAHEQRVADFRAANPQAVVRKQLSIADHEAIAREAVAAKRAYRRSIGYVSDGELRNLLGAHYDTLAHKVRALINELTASEPEFVS